MLQPMMILVITMCCSPLPQPLQPWSLANPADQTMGIRSEIDTINRELNDLRKIVCFRKSEVFVERIFVFTATEKLVERNIHHLSC